MASRIVTISDMAFFAIPSELVSGVVRSCQSLSGTNSSPPFWPLPEKEKPSTETIACTPGCSRKYFSACSITDSVRAVDAPGGNWTLAST